MFGLTKEMSETEIVCHKWLVKQSKQFGSLDHVVVNAGVTQIGMIEYFTDEEVQTVIDINVTGAVRTVQSVVPIMREQNSGGITIISSVLGTTR